MMKIIGIDLGGTSVKMAILTLEGSVEHQWSIVTNTEDNGKNIVGDIVNSIKEFTNENNISLDSIKGIGMGSPGQIDFEKGTVRGAYNLGWAETQEVKSIFEKEFKVPFFIDNDANVAALGERWKGAGENAEDVVFVTLGTGVGGGVVADGKLLHGVRGSAGEIGHMIVEPNNGFECTCGNKGCLETVASATGVVKLAKDLIKEEETSLRKLIEEDSLTAKDIFDAAKQGDEFANKVIDKFAFYLGLSCSQLANALNPSFIVVGGGVSAAGDFLLERVRKEFEKFAFPPVRESTKLALATLGNDAGVIGAASLVLQ
ncbi:MAG: ROK family glucokinase [Gemella sp.]|nr:ROK family glucokinase [Gemella sp.]